MRSVRLMRSIVVRRPRGGDSAAVLQVRPCGKRQTKRCTASDASRVLDPLTGFVVVAVVEHFATPLPKPATMKRGARSAHPPSLLLRVYLCDVGRVHGVGVRVVLVIAALPSLRGVWRRRRLTRRSASRRLQRNPTQRNARARISCQPNACPDPHRIPP